MTEKAAIAIVDDDAAVLDSLDALLRAAGHETVTFQTAGDFLAQRQRPDIGVVLLDVRLPDADGIDIFETLQGEQYGKPVVIMTGHGDVPMAVKAMRLGAADFIQKPFTADVLIDSVDRALDDEQERTAQATKAAQATECLSRLTDRESEVMHQLVIGRANKAIAIELDLSPRTVEIHRARVMEKTGARSLSHLVRLAIAAGIDPDE